ncbi:exodeoxyribonuclease VII large subunit [Legionella pneumophila]|nr:exodeoxyribonuclease VII large subunit [Legionella pneumophila]
MHVEGEISNLSKPSSGHYYFTLKDSTAQIRCAFFKNRHSNSLLRNFNDGQQIVATGKLSLYEARGEYQLIVEEIVEAGMGILYQRFEELKIKLASEGLFNPEKKNTAQNTRNDWHHYITYRSSYPGHSLDSGPSIPNSQNYYLSK